MQIDLKHSRNVAIGWDLDVTVTAEGNETISHVRVVSTSGGSGCDEDVADGTRKWHRVLTQQGQYPGDNKVLATATDQNGTESSSEDAWE